MCAECLNPVFEFHRTRDWGVEGEVMVGGGGVEGGYTTYNELLLYLEGCR